VNKEIGAAMAFCLVDTDLLDAVGKHEALSESCKCIGNKVVYVTDVARVVERCASQTKSAFISWRDL